MARVLPVVTDWNRFFWTSGADGRLRFQRCADCGTLRHPSGPSAAPAGPTRPRWPRSSGRGVVQSCTTNYQQWSPDYPVPYSVAVVAIEEDPRIRLTTNIVGCAPDEVVIGMRVRVRFEQEEGRLAAPLRAHRRAHGRAGRRERGARADPLGAAHGAAGQVRGRRRTHGHRHVAARPQVDGRPAVPDGRSHHGGGGRCRPHAGRHRRPVHLPGRKRGRRVLRGRRRRRRGSARSAPDLAQRRARDSRGRGIAH